MAVYSYLCQIKGRAKMKVGYNMWFILYIFNSHWCSTHHICLTVLSVPLLSQVSSLLCEHCSLLGLYSGFCCHPEWLNIWNLSWHFSHCSLTACIPPPYWLVLWSYLYLQFPHPFYLLMYYLLPLDSSQMLFHLYLEFSLLEISPYNVNC